MVNDSEDETTRSAGRGMLVDDDVPAEKREEMARELEAEIRGKRRTQWTSISERRG